MTDEVKPEKVWVTYLKRAGYIATAVTAIAVLGFSIDGRYQKAEAAEQETLSIRADADRQVQAQLVTDYAQNLKREEGDIRTQITLIQLELNFMQKQQIADESRKIWLTEQLKVLLSRLTELQK